MRAASNVASAELVSGLLGDDGEALDTTVAFSIDADTGKFSGTPPPTNGVSGTFAPLVPILLPAQPHGHHRLREGQGWDRPGCAGRSTASAPATSFTSPSNSGGSLSHFWCRLLDRLERVRNSSDRPHRATGCAPGAADPTTAARYGIPAGAGAPMRPSGSTSISTSNPRPSRARPRGGNLLNDAGGSTGQISPGGSRWFSGDNETVDHPGVGIRVGHLDGVDTVWAPIHHTDMDPVTPGAQAAANSANIQFFGYGGAGLSREADVQITWGAGGAVESVRDLTHHLAVHFVPISRPATGS